ncbi:MAG TPA: (2Fe-2S)-binding protein [Noviherbaspirillum sp.]|uniref:(2Fe-2S)-binding protein n=1 Tax=Noviherbaspirillum sp. TaxID=1926288 RepID=UPI002B45C83A|nr:(2Fe-2S)-binding protein [Noviherbaspirillum sp.]HJV84752.1 (2Fe-2S)-binding protein [Noviherbaspirillum sp.]
MIVCVCQNVSESKIRQAVNSGITTMPALRTELGVGTCCGKCHSCAKTVLRECLEEGVREAQPLMFSTAIAA